MTTNTNQNDHKKAIKAAIAAIDNQIAKISANDKALVEFANSTAFAIVNHSRGIGNGDMSRAIKLVDAVSNTGKPTKGLIEFFLDFGAFRISRSNGKWQGHKDKDIVISDEDMGEYIPMAYESPTMQAKREESKAKSANTRKTKQEEQERMEAEKQKVFDALQDANRDLVHHIDKLEKGLIDGNALAVQQLNALNATIDSLSADNVALKSDNDKLQADNNVLMDTIARLQAELTALRQDAVINMGKTKKAGTK